MCSIECISYDILLIKHYYYYIKVTDVIEYVRQSVLNITNLKDKMWTVKKSKNQTITKTGMGSVQISDPSCFFLNTLLHVS